jgi:hypothetical protein
MSKVVVVALRSKVKGDLPPKFRIQWRNQHGKFVSLSADTRDEADILASRVRSMLAALHGNTPISTEVAEWIGRQPYSLRSRLVKKGLVAKQGTNFQTVGDGRRLEFDSSFVLGELSLQRSTPRQFAIQQQGALRCVSSIPPVELTDEPYARRAGVRQKQVGLVRMVNRHTNHSHVLATSAIDSLFEPCGPRFLYRRVPTVYLLSLCGVVVYAGQSNSVATRLGSHLLDKKFDTMWCREIEAPVGWSTSRLGDILNTVEAYWIAACATFYNNRSPIVSVDFVAYANKHCPHFLYNYMPSLNVHAVERQLAS